MKPAKRLWIIEQIEPKETILHEAQDIKINVPCQTYTEHPSGEPANGFLIVEGHKLTLDSAGVCTID